MFQRCWNHQPEPAKIMGFLTYGIPKSHRISLVSLLYNVRGTHVQDWKWPQWRCIYVHPQNDEIGIICIYIYIIITTFQDFQDNWRCILGTFTLSWSMIARKWLQELVAVERLLEDVAGTRSCRRSQLDATFNSSRSSHGSYGYW